eukprot:2417597-Rhodomonas_salina.1
MGMGTKSRIFSWFHTKTQLHPDKLPDTLADARTQNATIAVHLLPQQSSALDDELVVDIMGRMTVKQIVRLRVAGTWGKQLIEGSSFSGIWKTAFRIVFTTQYLAIPLDDNRNWYQEFMQVVEQNPNRYPPASWACKPQD